MSNTSVLAIIPARGGSLGIPMKNLVPLASIPLVAYSIAQARGAARVDRVVVSTDSHEIAEVSEKWGAEVIDRPADISAPESTTESAMIHAINQVECDGYHPTHCVLLQPTSPFRDPGAIDGALAALIDGGFDSLLSVETSHISLWTPGEETATAQYDFENRVMRQEVIDRQRRENGSIYAFTTELLKTTNNRLGGNIALHLSNEVESLEIDTLFDLWVCQQVVENNKWPYPLPQLPRVVDM
jgi:CMP-N,N'-diacetyllegionaminic acid synthase